MKAAGRGQGGKGGLSTGCTVQLGAGRKVLLPSGGQVGCRLIQKEGGSVKRRRPVPTDSQNVSRSGSLAASVPSLRSFWDCLACKLRTRL